MTQRIITPFRSPSRPLLSGRRSWAVHWGGFLLMLVASAVIVCGLVFAPEAWAGRYEREHLRVWRQSVREDPQPIERLLLLVPRLSSDFPRDPTEVKTVLGAFPTLVALVRRGEEGPKVLVREDNGYVAATGPRADRFLSWARQARASGLAQWYPTPDNDPEVASTPTLVLAGQDWTCIKCWEIGSPAVEKLLRRALGPYAEVRVGVQRVQAEDVLMPPVTPPSSAFEPPNIQAWPAGSMHRWNACFPSSVLGPGWEFVCQPWPDLGLAWNRDVIIQRRIAWVGSLAVALFLAAGWWSRHRTKQRKAAEASRLASLLHSLKTPLAVHMLRCDLLRMGRLDPPRAAEELMLLGQDLDDLNRLIERGLTGLREDHGTSAWGRLGPDWIRSQAEDLAVIFEDTGRPLELEVGDFSLMAHEASLRSGLQTLLENAYFHGRGTVRLRTWRDRNQLCIEVSDEGPGVDAKVLHGIGQPFRRFGEDLPKEGGGHGLGLHLLFQIARQEGWGLSLRSAPGEGFAATLQLPVSGS